MYMKVSVIVRTYNRAYVIMDALKSIAKQACAPWEIIVVDDGSTDNTRDVVNAFNGSRVRYLRHEQNRGVAAACNTGIEAATGDLIAFLDSDDVWTPEYLKRQTDFLRHQPAVGAVFTDTRIEEYGGAQRILSGTVPAFQKLIRAVNEEAVLSRRDIYLCLLQEVPIKPSALVIRRDALNNAGKFNEGWNSGEDWEFLLRLVGVTDFGYINLPLVIQRQYADATHRLHRIDDKLRLLNLFTGQQPFLRHDREATAAIRRGIASHCNILGFSYLQSGERFKAARAYLRGFIHTGELMMLARAVTSYVPLGLRERLRRASKRIQLTPIQS